MQGHVVLHDLKFAWEIVDAGTRLDPRRCTLHVRFGDLGVSRSYPNRLSKAQAQREAETLAPHVLHFDEAATVMRRL